MATTLFLTGAAWNLLVVQLPLFFKVGQPEVLREQRVRNTAFLTFPMAAEFIAAIWLGQAAGIVLVLVIWLVTFAFYIPAYTRLIESYDPARLRRLIAWQWIRTLCWTGRSAILLWITVAALNI